jgi:hypothetical protein
MKRWNLFSDHGGADEAVLLMSQGIQCITNKRAAASALVITCAVGIFNSGQYSRKNIALSRVGCETAELGNCATGTCRVDDAQG